MMKKKNKGKKTLAAVGAVVAAGLTPGIIAATPNAMPVQDPNIGLTAAEVVAIAGNTYSFDELYAMQQPAAAGVQEEAPQVALRYGVQPRPTRPVKPTPPTAKYAAPRPPGQHETYYGVPRPHIHPQPPIDVIEVSAALDTIQEGLMEFCIQIVDADPYTQGVGFTIDSDLTREIGMNDYQLKELKAIIEDYYGVEVSYPRFYLVGQLNTLRLVSEYIYKLKTVWTRE